MNFVHKLYQKQKKKKIKDGTLYINFTKKGRR